MKNKVLHCRDCGDRFVFDARQRRRYAENDWPEPIRCPNCRSRKRELWETNEAYRSLMKGGGMKLYGRAERARFHKLGG